MNWTTDTSYNIKISWKYNGKQTKRRRIHKFTMVNLTPTKVHKDKRESLPRKESLAQELGQVLREDG